MDGNGGRVGKTSREFNEAKSTSGCDLGERREDRGGRLSQEGGSAACGNRGHSESGGEGKGSEVVCDVGAVFDSWKDASMHRSDRGVWDPGGDLRCGRCGSEKCGRCGANSFPKKDPGREGNLAGGV